MARVIQFLGQKRRDVCIGVLIGFIFGCMSYYGSGLMPPVIFEEKAYDFWFQSDPPAIFDTTNKRKSGFHMRNNTHPFFSLVVYPLTYVLKQGFGLDAVTSLRLITACVAFLWILSFFILLRMLKCRMLDVVFLSFLMMTSSAAMFWFVLPETFSFGSLSILWALIALVLAQQYSFSVSWYILINFVTFAFVITNWMAGILVTMVQHPFKKAAQILANSVCVFTLLWGIVKLIFPETDFFLDFHSEVEFINPRESGGPLIVARSFFYHTLIMPIIEPVGNYHFSGTYWALILSVQNSLPGSAGYWGLAAAIVWTGLLLIGLWALFSLKEHGKLRFVLGCLLIGQLGMHFVYGEETFLYSLHFVVLLILLVALGFLTKLRPVAISLVFILIPCVFINNVAQFQTALSHLMKMVNL